MKHPAKAVLLIPLGIAALFAACSPRVTIKHWPEPGKPKRVAILPFKDAAGAPGSGALVNAALNTEFLSITAYEVVERGALDDVLKEHQLGTSGIIDESHAVEIGKLLNADSVILGTITEFQERRALILPPATVAVSLRLVNTKTGVVEWTASHRVGGLKRLFTWIVPAVGVVATVISPTASEQAQHVARAICKAAPKAAAELAARPR
jgi:curli biogenesis system outer membrane secretion channel CsgG